jgi:dihydrofolate reductase
LKLSIVVAMAENGVIGIDNRLPWRLPADLARFKALTMGKPILMGRKTYDSIGRALPGRTNIVVSRQALVIPGCTVVSSIESGIEAAGAAEELMVIGGGEIYRQVLPRVSTVHLTRVHTELAGDAKFPPLCSDAWRTTDVESRAADATHGYAFTFRTLERVSVDQPA